MSAQNSQRNECDDQWYDESFRRAAHWKEHYTRSHYYFLWSAVADRIRIGEHAQVLDIGCGPGQFACLLRDNGTKRYLGIDFSGARLEQARKVCPEFQFFCEDAFTSDCLADREYDCVVMMEILEHIHEDRRLAARVRPGCRLIATVPNFPYESHVRHFDAADEVRDRYSDLFTTVRVDEFLENQAGRKYFLLDGVRSERVIDGDASRDSTEDAT